MVRAGGSPTRWCPSFAAMMTEKPDSENIRAVSRGPSAASRRGPKPTRCNLRVDQPFHSGIPSMGTANTSPPEVLIFSDEYPPDGGGAGIVAKQLGKGLKALGKRVVMLVGKSPRGRAEEEDTVECPRIKLFWPLAYAYALWRMRAWRIPHFVLNDYISAYVAGLFFSQAMLRRSVIIVHGNDSKFFFARKTRKHRIYQYGFFYARAVRHCKQIVCASRYAMEEYLKFGQGKVDAAKVTYAYMGLDPQDLGTPKRTKSELGISEGGTMLFSASRLDEDKGLIDMMLLYVEALSIMPNLYWHIAGEGALRPEIEAFIQQHGLSEKVKLLGRLDRSAMADYYQSADLFWLLSKRETFGLVYVEAGWFGCPSLALRVAGVPEAIEEGVSGFFHVPGLGAADQFCKVMALSRDACQAHARKFESLAFAKAINAYLES